ncbi:hypothetical protein [Flavobacterium hungaricum]|uniref:Uncharacterized protein n=1 Tax=Flavobacterium hungaricum TaxID=2082725 RepID=A0ABR9TR70_9FLAO|nr:hypothetical protein [Flavobacterium hungaricum]MBE8727878.1 hypothetical protein [Flavobacterium hungaricum]
MKKLNFGIILIQFFGVVFLINGILQLRLFTAAEKISCAKKHLKSQNTAEWMKMFPTKEAINDFWPSVFIWIFFALLIGIFIISYLNWKSKISSLNTILVAIVLYVLLRFKFFRREIISLPFRPLRNFVSNDYGIQCLIEGIIFTLIGLTLLYFSTSSRLFGSKNDPLEN